jgi:drug/metabolite transporter (DMT)-like permease
MWERIVSNLKSKKQQAAKVNMKWLIVLGIVLTVGGVLLALFSFKDNAKVMGDAALGVAVFAPEKGSGADLEKRRLRKRSDRLFYWGIGFAIAGGLMQAVGTAFSKQ